MELRKHKFEKGLENEKQFVLSYSEIEHVFLENRSEWNLSQITIDEFLNFLTGKGRILKKIEYGPYSRRVAKYYFAKKNIDPYVFATSLVKMGYLSHLSAVYFHGLIDDKPKFIYVNMDQSPKNLTHTLEDIPQENIDEVFKKPPRKTTNFVNYKSHRIHILNGRYTQETGVCSYNKMRVTDLERTLIDITVRPHYAGGIKNVLEFYRKAKGQISIDRLNSYLKTINYVYPYHQSIGYLMEKSGHEDVDVLAKQPIFRDFYLTYKMEDPSYNEKWSLYHPKGW